MPSRHSSRQSSLVFRGAVGLCALCALALQFLMAQDARASFGEYEVKAVFLYNFAKFVEWPPSQEKGPIKIGILGEDPFGDHLEKIVRGKTVRNRSIETLRFPTVDDLQVCHILFISQSEAKQVPNIVRTLTGTPVLTVGEGRGFAEEGGMIGLVIDSGKVRFDINAKAARSSGITVRSQLLDLARSVKQ